MPFSNMSHQGATLSALGETYPAESNTAVPRQQSYTGEWLVIPLALANISCEYLGVEGVLEKLNILRLMSYTQFSNLTSPEITTLALLMPTYNHTGHRYLWAISHAWVEEKECNNVWTHINAYKWPVPIPKGANLDLIRIEMLNLGAEYMWLDVLCLRQPGGWGEDEVSDRPIIGGETGDDGIMEEVVWKRFYKQLESLWHDDPVFGILWQMQTRVSMNPLDEIAGLAYLFQSLSIPIYDALQSEEEAWESLVDMMPYSIQRALFFFFPEPGNGNRHWRPSWHQGLASGLPNGKPRHRKLIIKDDAGQSHTFTIIANHAYPIPDGCWVVGRQREDGRFEKIWYFSMADDGEREKLEDMIKTSTRCSGSGAMS
ncbi:hypothetical protein IW261DRAFT_1415576 [Armillaria novae-zelandiae]|uniref:Heterokaryon incompatibility domain-containing protein n=1 Tax=Armillaria novae-zelandiae TaxID=153914 RepID=A0AA39PP70_9AGAR|nr:hypothetical protein IW261DRAFT_1415576 [Armillaria novae-zelandiae]